MFNGSMDLSQVAGAVIFPCSVGVFFFSLWNNQSLQKERAQAKQDLERAGLIGADQPYQAGVFRVVMMVLSYAFASTATFMFNKAVITQVPFPHFVVAVQCIASIGIFLVLNYKDIHFGSFRTSVMWFVCVAFLFAAMLWSSMVALQFTTVTAMYICRNFMPILTYPIEYFGGFPGTPNPTAWIILSLIGIFAGTIMFVAPSWNMSIGLIGVLFLLANTGATILERLLERRLLHDHKVALAEGRMEDYMSTISCSLINNAGTFIILFIYGCALGQFNPFFSALADNIYITVLLISSCFTAASLSFAGIDLQAEITATQFLVTQNGIKCIGILFGIILFSDTIGILSGFGVAMTLGSAFGYGFATSQAKLMMKKNLQSASHMSGKSDLSGKSIDKSSNS